MNYIVIGGGLAGLMAARALRDERPDADITVIERNAALGGLLGGVEYEEQELYFDLGTHIFQETGNAVLDQALLGAVAPEDLLHFPIGDGDLAGAVFAGRLQVNTHFPDLRGGATDTQVADALRGHVATGGAVPAIDRTGPMLGTAGARFGREFAERVLGPTLSRAYCQPAADLAGFALLLPGWTRVVLDDHDEWLRRSGDDRYRTLVAVPDQRDLPARFRHGRRSFYSRTRGSRAFVDGIADGLRADGVRIDCGATIVALDPSSRRIELVDGSGAERTLTADGLVIATGVVGAAHLLGVDLAQKGFDRPMPHWVFNIQLDEPCASDLCYLYGLDAGCDWYRVTNYHAFSGDPSDRRLSIEVVGRRDVDPVTWPSRLVGQLRDIGLIESTGMEFADARKLGAGFPAPTVRNMRSLAGLGEELSASLPAGVLLGGIGAGAGLFFQNEVVADIHARVASLD